MTGTYESAWKDKLLSWDGTAMTYDAIGNMLTRGGTTYTWTQGRRLSGVENGKSIKYLYDNIGARVKKTVPDDSSVSFLRKEKISCPLIFSHCIVYCFFHSGQSDLCD